MFAFRTSRSGKLTELFLKRVLQGNIYSDLERYGQIGVDALSNATPVDSGETAQSWRYRVIQTTQGHYGIAWYNEHENDGVNVAILIQYGHGTGTGGYVQGRNFINPAIQPIFDKIAEDVWKKVEAS